MFVLPPFFERKNAFFQLIFLLFFIIGGLIIFNLLGQLIAIAVWGNSVIESPTAGYIRLTQFFNAIGTFLIPALLFSYCAQKKFFSYANAQTLPPLQSWLYIAILSTTLLPIISFFVYLNMQMNLPDSWSSIESWMRNMENENENLITLITNDSRVSILLLNLLICAVVPAICEEFFFRGTLQQFLSQRFSNKHVAILVTAFIFSAIHLQFYGFIPRFLLGIYLGYLFVWTGSIWAPIVAHFLHNGISITMHFFGNIQNVEPTTDYIITDELTWLIAAVFLSIGAIYRLWKIYRTRSIQN